MRLIWVKGSLPLSKMIMWGLKEPVSHFAVVFDEKIVFHSDLLGVRIAWLPTFLKSHEIVFEKKYPSATLEIQEEVYQSIITRFDGKPYDYKAFLYFTWRAILNRVLGIPFPEKNKFGTSNTFLCTEIAEILPNKIIPQTVKTKDLGICSPYKLWLLLKDML